MELKIYWTDFSKRSLRDIFEYYRSKAGKKIAKKIVDEIYNQTFIIVSQPEIGQIEPLLVDRQQEFRYLIFKNYKIIYWFNSEANRIEINDVFDTRQDPINIRRNK
ncbi:MAG: type II toxin-antitoxin system RelE/ParE family toxin [Flavobacterium sp.]